VDGPEEEVGAAARRACVYAGAACDGVGTDERERARAGNARAAKRCFLLREVFPALSVNVTEAVNVTEGFGKIVSLGQAGSGARASVISARYVPVIGKPVTSPDTVNRLPSSTPEPEAVPTYIH
jgi:hypothetical protein